MKIASPVAARRRRDGGPWTFSGARRPRRLFWKNRREKKRLYPIACRIKPQCRFHRAFTPWGVAGLSCRGEETKRFFAHRRSGPERRGEPDISGGRSSGFRLFATFPPSRRIRRQWLAWFRPGKSLPGYSGGTATDSHRLPWQGISPVRFETRRPDLATSSYVSRSPKIVKIVAAAGLPPRPGPAGRKRPARR